MKGKLSISIPYPISNDVENSFSLTVMTLVLRNGKNYFRIANVSRLRPINRGHYLLGYG